MSQRNRRLALLAFSVALIFILLGITEMILRARGYVPGKIENPGLQMRKVDSLILDPNYTVGQDGIMRISESGRELVRKYLNGNPSDFEKDQLAGQELEFTIEHLIRDFLKLNSGASSKSEFGDFIKTLQSKNQDSLQPDEKVYLDYAKSPINTNGFRSIGFEKLETTKKRILLLGDSFTWGLGAEPVFNSFADILTARGYVIYNTGIGATDPPQYAAIAKQLIPLLQPDVVIINICMANDQMGFERKTEPFHYTFHPTNAGWLNAYYDGCYRDAPTSYAHFLELMKIPNMDKSLFNKVCAKTVLSTKLWILLSRFNWVDDSQPATCNVPWDFQNPITEKYIDNIQELCNLHGSKLIVSLIPDNNKLGEQTEHDALLNFRHTKYYYMKELNENDYHSGEVHFNNTGYKRYTDFLQALIDSNTQNNSQQK